MVVQHDSEILSLVISDQDELHRSYMPLIIDGGLFIATQETFALNHEFFFYCGCLMTLNGYLLRGK